MRVLVLAVCVAVLLAGCGRRGAPLPPGPPADVTYPHIYPAY